MQYLVMFLIALLITSIGFRKYIWFISIGYGFSVAAIGLAMIVFFRRYMSNLMLCICLLFFIYGVRLGGYLLIRELKLTTYNAAMKNEVKSDISLPAKFATWIFSALLYTLQVSPVLFRLSNGGTTDIATLVGAVIMACGIILESAADVQKSIAKKKNPKRFVDTGLFRIVRCPNYLGEILFWTGVFVSGVTALRGPVQWICAIIGYVCIVYIMFGGARRLELRQNRNYGDDPEYQKYVKTVPIILPFIPLYSVADYTFLVG
jgi:steroid 5-alpha reductase family enzyme